MKKYQMIELKCSECGKPVKTDGIIWGYEEMVKGVKQKQTVCNKCINKWKDDNKILSAEFIEKDFEIVAKVKCNNGYHEYGTQVILNKLCNNNLNLPEEFWDELNKYYDKHRENRQKVIQEQTKMNLKYVDFNKNEWLGTMFTCETRNGDVYENIIYRFDNKNVIVKPGQQKIPPEYVIKQVTLELKRRLGLG